MAGIGQERMVTVVSFRELRCYLGEGMSMKDWGARSGVLSKRGMAIRDWLGWTSLVGAAAMTFTLFFAMGPFGCLPGLVHGALAVCLLKSGDSDLARFLGLLNLLCLALVGSVIWTMLPGHRDFFA